ncbi:MAG TPA: zinc ribbon domain-containing protein, partial [Blastocatellia bacterium]|nr:zinc ribbon domain-containing protein [Blastocatellia bacterium]
AYKGETVQWVHVGKRNGRKPDEQAAQSITLPPGVTPAIVTPELWQRANERLTANKGDKKRNESRPYLLRGHMTCARCGLRMYPTPKHKKGVVFRYYGCSSRSLMNIPACGALLVRAEPCEEFVWQEVVKYLQNPDLIAAELKRAQKQGVDSQLLADKRAAESALERNEQGQQRLVKRLRYADDMLAAIIEKELKQAEKERRALAETIAELDRQIAGQEQITVNLKTLYDYCQGASQTWARADFDKKRLALEALGIQVIAEGREWRITAALDIAGAFLNTSSAQFYPTTSRRRSSSPPRRAGQ